MDQYSANHQFSIFQSIQELFPGYGWFMGNIEVTNNFLYSIKFEDGKENNWSEDEIINRIGEFRIPVVDVGYKFVRNFRSVPFSGEVVEILDNQSRKCQFCDRENKTTPFNRFSLRQVPDQDVLFDLILWYIAKTIPTLLE